MLYKNTADCFKRISQNIIKSADLDHRMSWLHLKRRLGQSVEKIIPFRQVSLAFQHLRLFINVEELAVALTARKPGYERL